MSACFFFFSLSLGSLFQTTNCILYTVGKTKISCKDNNIYCPTKSTLQNMKSMSFWGEGVEGDVALDIRYIGAIGCNNDNDIIASSTTDAIDAAAIITSGNHQQQEHQELLGGGLQIVTLFCVIVSMMALFGSVTAYRRIVSNKKQESYVEIKGFVIV
jgi:hypothetical protein